MFNICDLPERLVVGDGLELVLDLRKHFGRGELADIVWYQYKIVNYEEKGIVYDNICLSMFRITEEIRLSAADRIIEKNVSKPYIVRPHIDYKTGNIHPSKEYVEQMGKQEKVSQLVLCKGLGPNTPKEKGENMYVYKNKPRQYGTKIHKACYFPLIEDDSGLHDDWRYKCLSEVWERIHCK